MTIDSTTPAPDPSGAVWSDPINVAKYGTEVTPEPSEALDDLLSAIDAGHAISSNWVRRVVTDLRRAEQAKGAREALAEVERALAPLLRQSGPMFRRRVAAVFAARRERIGGGT